MEEFVPGDIVQLKSGGPVMTVEQVGKDSMTGQDAVWCTWFEKVGNRQDRKTDTFSPVTLAKRNSPSAATFAVRTERA
jgi:uncharacterized protein YodC (DUF2158 family)